MNAQSHKTIVLADSSKLGHQAIALVATLFEIDYLVTNEYELTGQNVSLAARIRVVAETL